MRFDKVVSYHLSMKFIKKSYPIAHRRRSGQSAIATSTIGRSQSCGGVRWHERSNAGKLDAAIRAAHLCTFVAGPDCNSALSANEPAGRGRPVGRQGQALGKNRSAGKAKAGTVRVVAMIKGTAQDGHPFSVLLRVAHTHTNTG